MITDQLADICLCGHSRYQHVTSNGAPTDCTGRCLCELCPVDTSNDCWCATFRHLTGDAL